MAKLFPTPEMFYSPPLGGGDYDSPGNVNTLRQVYFSTSVFDSVFSQRCGVFLCIWKFDKINVNKTFGIPIDFKDAALASRLHHRMTDHVHQADFQYLHLTASSLS